MIADKIRMENMAS